ncbi:MAG TPA: CdaR family protein [Bacillota bacterium]|nr:CdaR family protein [Bacillota bacterium]
MDNWFNNKWFVRAVSLAFAILLYVFVSFEGTTTDSRIPSETDRVEVLENIPVDILIDEDEYVVSGVPEVVTLSLEGPYSILMPTAKQQNFDVFVDLRDLEAGEHTVEIDHDRIPSELSVYIEPKTTNIVIEERATEEFPVQVDFINEDQLPDGYELGTVEVNPGTVTVTSSRTIIEQIAMVKVFVDVAGLTESINNREVPVNVYDNQGNGLNIRVVPENVVVSVDVDNPNKTVNVSVSTTGELPNGFEVIEVIPDIEEIEIFARRSILESIDEILTADINLADINESATIPVDLIVPDGVVVEDDKIDVTIKLEQTREFTDVPIEIENEADNQTITFNTPDEPVINLTVTGEDELIKDLSVDDFQLSIDIADLEEGEHRLPIKVEGPDDVDIQLDVEEVIINIET